MRRYLFLSIFFFTSHAWSFTWTDLWSTADQQGMELMQKGQFAKAQEKFRQADWAAAAAYKAGDYERANDILKKSGTEQGYYNQGNALAHLGKYEQAIEAYNKALKINPKNADAIYNRNLLKELLKKDKEQEQNQESQDNKNSDQNKKQQAQQDNNQKQDEQNKQQNQENTNQQDKNQQDKEQQDKEQQEKAQQEQRQNQKSKGNDKQEDIAQSQVDEEKKQANEQWLKLIPDDPGGLMREKFLRDHIRRERGWYQ